MSDGRLAEALQLQRSGRLDAAERLYRRLLDDEADNVDALHNLGAIRLQRGDGAGAEALLRRAIAAAPQRINLRRSLGLALDELGRHRAAAAAFLDALELQPDDPVALGHLAATLRRAGKANIADRVNLAAASLRRLGEGARNDWRDRSEFARYYSLVARDLVRVGAYRDELFAGSAVTALRLQDPIQPIERLLAVRSIGNEQSEGFLTALFRTVAAIDPHVRLLALEFADFPGFRPLPGGPRSGGPGVFGSHRDMKVRLVSYRGDCRAMPGSWHRLAFAVPWNWLSDLIVPIVAETADGRSGRGVIQAFHAAMPVPLQQVLAGGRSAEQVTYSAFAEQTPGGGLIANPRDYGGGLVSVTDRLALVDRRMSQRLKDAYRRFGVVLIELDVPTEIGHADELFAVLPDPASPCGRALLVMAPRPARGDGPTLATVQSIERTAALAVAAIRQVPGLDSLRSFAIPTDIADRNTVDANPLNHLAAPTRGRTAVLLGAMQSAARADEIRRSFATIAEATGRPVDLHYLDLAEVDPMRSGSLRCLTVEWRSPRD